MRYSHNFADMYSKCNKDDEQESDVYEDTVETTSEKPGDDICLAKFIICALLFNVALCLCNVSLQLFTFQTMSNLNLNLNDVEVLLNRIENGPRLPRPPRTVESLECKNANNFIFCQNNHHTEIHGSLNFPNNLTTHEISNEALCGIYDFLTNLNATLHDRLFFQGTFSAYFYYGTVSRCHFTEPSKKPKMRVDCDNIKTLSHDTCSLK